MPITLQDFLTAIWPATGGFREFRIIEDHKGGKFLHRSFCADNDTALQVAQDLISKYNVAEWQPYPGAVYYGVAIRKIQDGTKAAVSYVEWLWSDFDWKTMDELQAAAEVQAMNPQPNIVVKSGHGYHCYWQLDSPTLVEPAESAMKRIASHLGLDRVHDVSRILRLPFSRNFKDLANVVDCSIAQFDLSWKCNVNDFTSWAELPKEPEKIADYLCDNAVNTSTGEVTNRKIISLQQLRDICEAIFDNRVADAWDKPDLLTTEPLYKVVCKSLAIARSLGYDLDENSVMNAGISFRDMWVKGQDHLGGEKITKRLKYGGGGGNYWGNLWRRADNLTHNLLCLDSWDRFEAENPLTPEEFVFEESVTKDSPAPTSPQDASVDQVAVSIETSQQDAASAIVAGQTAILTTDQDVSDSTSPQDAPADQVAVSVNPNPPDAATGLPASQTPVSTPVAAPPTQVAAPSTQVAPKTYSLPPDIAEALKASLQARAAIAGVKLFRTERNKWSTVIYELIKKGLDISLSQNRSDLADCITHIWGTSLTPQELDSTIDHAISLAGRSKQKNLTKIPSNDVLIVKDDCLWVQSTTTTMQGNTITTTRQITNFLVQPRFTIAHELNSRSIRFCCAFVARHGESKTLRVDGSTMASLHDFKKWISSKGGFWFNGGDKDLCLLHDHIITNCRDRHVTETDRLGLLASQDKDTWIFKNIAVCNGEIIQPDPSDKNIFWLFSDKGVAAGEPKGYPEICTLTDNNVEETKTRFAPLLKLYGPKLATLLGGAVAIPVLSDVIWENFRFVPELYISGESKTGKTSAEHIIGGFWGLLKNLGHNAQSTYVGIWRELSRRSNMPYCISEFRNELANKHKPIGEAIRNAYDRVSRTTGVKSNDLETQSYDINATLLVSGEELPKGEAEMSRGTVFWLTAENKIPPAEYRELIRNINDFSRYTIAMILKRHDLVPAFLDRISQFEQFFRSHNIESRMSTNRAINAAAFMAFQDVLGIELFSEQDMLNAFFREGEESMEITQDEGITATFWENFLTLSSTHSHYDSARNEVCVIELGIDYKLISDNHPKCPQVIGLAIHFAAILDKISIHLGRVGLDRMFSRSTVRHYLRGKPYYQEEKLVWFKTTPKRSMIFDWRKLPDNIRDSLCRSDDQPF